MDKANFLKIAENTMFFEYFFRILVLKLVDYVICHARTSNIQYAFAVSNWRIRGLYG